MHVYTNDKTRKSNNDTLPQINSSTAEKKTHVQWKVVILQGRWLNMVIYHVVANETGESLYQLLKKVHV